MGVAVKHACLLCVASLIALAGGCRAEGVRGNLADLSIIDRDSGPAGESYVPDPPG